MSRLIGLTGPAGCGKSTIAQAIDLHCTMRTELDVKRLRFAGILKAMLRTLGLTEAQVDGDQKEVPCDLLGGKSARTAMQLLGTDWGRDMIDPGLWVRATMLLVDDALSVGKLVVIDDLRFDNEARAIKARGGLVIQLQRPGVSFTGEHASEVGVSGHLVDHIVPNADALYLVAQHILQLLQAHNS